MKLHEKGLTLAVELHGWRTGYSTDLFYVWVRFGFFSLAFSRLLVSEALKRMRDRADKVSTISKLSNVVLIKHGGTVE